MAYRQLSGTERQGLRALMDALVREETKDDQSHFVMLDSMLVKRGIIAPCEGASGRDAKTKKKRWNAHKTSS